jgi:hypothetical protein
VLLYNKDENDKQITLDKLDYTLSKFSLKTFLPKNYIISLFNTYITEPYGQCILKKDESFFMNLTEQDLLSETYGKTNNDSISFLTKIFKDLWEKMDKEVQDKIWQRMQILVKLCEKWKTE